MKPWKLAKTYFDELDHGGGVAIIASAARNGRDGSGAVVEDILEVADSLLGAVIARAVVELAKGSFGLLHDVVENGWDIARPICVGIASGRGGIARGWADIVGGWVGIVRARRAVARDGGGEGHSTGSNDTEDGGETHADEV